VTRTRVQTLIYKFYFTKELNRRVRCGHIKKKYCPQVISNRTKGGTGSGEISRDRTALLLLYVPSLPSFGIFWNYKQLSQASNGQEVERYHETEMHSCCYMYHHCHLLAFSGTTGSFLKPQMDRK
jgi:hypothetical protein